MKVLELFSGTHSIGKVCKEHGYEVVSLDRDLGAKCPFGSNYESDIHIKEDIMTWDYKKDFKVGEFDLITASPVCLWWSRLRNTWIGRKLKSMDRPLTKEDINNDIAKYGEPMVDKVFEIIDYFNPTYWWIENPQTGRMKEYINDLIPFYDVDYCKYSDFGYKKKTRFWTNIEGFVPKICHNDCENMIEIKTQEGDIHPGSGKQIKAETRKLHNNVISYKKQKAIKKHLKTFGAKPNNGQKNVGGGSNKFERYRIPSKLINEFIEKTKESTIKRHKIQLGRESGGGVRKLEKYRIPSALIAELLCHSHS